LKDRKWCTSNNFHAPLYSGRRYPHCINIDIRLPLDQDFEGVYVAVVSDIVKRSSSMDIAGIDIRTQRAPAIDDLSLDAHA
jgi:hypothetical protein